MASTTTPGKFRPSFQNILFGLILFLLAARFAALSWNYILRNANSANGDQAVFLRIGLDFRENGRLTDGKRPPLYTALLATFASRSWAFFTWAKLVNLLLGLLAIGATFEVGRRLFDRTVGLLGAALLAINAEFIAHSSFVLAEPLLIVTMLMTWFGMVKALQRPQENRYWVLAGVFAGLTYLTKGTGPIIIIAFLMTLLLIHGLKVWRWRGPWIFVISFALVALPLWLYNLFTFGSPLYNSAISNIMWMDSGEEVFIQDESELPSLLTYVRDKSPAEIWNRLGGGLLAMRFVVVKLLWPVRSRALDSFMLVGGLDILLGVLLLLALLFWRQLLATTIRHKEPLLLTGLLCSAFYVLFGWYMPIVSVPIRFLLPLIPVVFILLAAALVGLTRSLLARLQHPPLANQTARLLLVGLGLGAAVWIGRSAAADWLPTPHSNPFVADEEYNEYTEQALRWVRVGHHDPKTISVLWGPSHDMPTWRHWNFFDFYTIPFSVETLEQFETYLTERAVTYVIIDEDMARRRKELLQAAGISRLGDGSQLLEVGNYPAGWALGELAPDEPCRWCVFRILAAAPPITPLDITLDETIRLFGYELDTEALRPGGQVVVTLYWEPLQPATIDYTVFTQLLGPDFQLHGQLDRQPLAGHRPTSRWQPGQKVVDKFVIPVDEAAPPGGYTLLLGLYDLNTGIRAMAVSNDQPLPDNAVRIPLPALEPAPQSPIP